MRIKPVVPPAKVYPVKPKFDLKSFAKNGVTEQEVAEIKYAFDLFDTDHGGVIDINELKAAMVSMGFESRNSAIFQMICDLDADGNGTIDFAEWVLLMTKRGNDKFNRANLEKMYSLFDDDHKEDITKENLRRVAQYVGEDISDYELNMLIKRGDRDHNGRISFEDFYALMTAPVGQLI